MKVRKKIVVCFSVTVFVVLLIASEVLVHGGTVQTTPARLQKISKNIWDIVENDNEIAGGSSMQTENQKPHETRKRTITAETVPYDGVKLNHPQTFILFLGNYTKITIFLPTIALRTSIKLV